MSSLQQQQQQRDERRNNISSTPPRQRQQQISSSLTRTKRRPSQQQPYSVQTLLLCGLSGAVCFYVGLLLGSHAACPQHPTTCPSESDIQRRIEESVLKATTTGGGGQKDASSAAQQQQRFPSSVRDFAVGMGRAPRDDFAAAFDMGVPLDKSSSQNQDVLILYNSEKAVPANALKGAAAASSTGGEDVPYFATAEEATQNCDFVNVVLTHPNGKNRRQCIALMGQYEAFHIQKFMRLPEDEIAGRRTGKLDSSLPLRLVNRGAQSSGRKSTHPPSKEETLKYWSILTTYFNSLQETMDKLRPTLEKIATKNTIIVLVCNFGQSELLMNFLCGARRRGLDTSSVLVFASDEETRDLALGMGVAAFYDETNYGSMPKDAAHRYADQNFMAMMLAKVFCVHITTFMGYDVLFQDVDIVWYTNPLSYFHDDPKQFDVYFQDDGNHALFYAPYSANTGFYYVRNNEKTRHFVNSLLVSGDLILTMRSHQIPLVALLQEHASMYGLRVKILERDGDDFPGGFTYHRRKDYMKQLVSNTGQAQPKMFHMSWTLNKDNKRKYFEQMGEWYWKDECTQKTRTTILRAAGKNGEAQDSSSPAQVLLEPCCAAEPLVTCHYKDKPSKIPCKDSPPIDKGGKSFW